MSKITALVEGLARPAVEEQGCSLWDVEYVKEAGSWYLRLYIDKEGGVSIDDCEAVSRAVDPLLDEADPIQDAYTFEVSSAGADRVLKRPEHFAAFLGAEVDVKFYRAIDGQKSCTGVLEDYSQEGLTLSAPGGRRQLAREDVASVRLHIKF
ncbi:MAG: ribosome maturation factor RimP [Ruminiclostridium sp.]|jgi:ribosome maturation factor RimP|nr:ribosome maturation factor RimP [Ruminiclostridium sp.]